MRTQATNQPLDKDLEDGSCDERVKQPDDGVVDIPEGADADLHDQEDGDGHEGCQQSGGPDGNNLISQRIAKLGEDNLAVGEGDGKGSGRGGICFVDLDGC